MASRTLVSIDGGKSTLRLLVASGQRREYGEGPGMVYQPDEDGVQRIVDSVRAAAAAVSLPTVATNVIAGLTGLPGDLNVRRTLASSLATLFRGPAVVVDDAVLAHAGALNGPGTVLSVGTGTNVLAVGAAGDHARLDGWGPVLGDRGSGHAIGLAGLRAAAAAHDEVGPPTVLAESLSAAVGGTDLASLQRFYRDPHLVARVAAFAEIVLGAAAHDEVAMQICDEAARALAAAARTAIARQPNAGTRVSYSGRLLTADGIVTARLRDELSDHGLDLAEPLGSPLEGGLAVLTGAQPYASLLAQARQQSGAVKKGDGE